MLQQILDLISSLFMNTDILAFVSIFLITLITSIVSTLKSIFVINKAGIVTYLLVAVDAILYLSIIKSLTTNSFIIASGYVLAKLLGTYIADIIESKLALGLYDIDIYIKEHTRQKEIQKVLLDNGYSSTMLIGTLSDNTPRWFLNVQLKRKNLPDLLTILESYGLSEPSMVIKPAHKITGKIQQHI